MTYKRSLYSESVHSQLSNKPFLVKIKAYFMFIIVKKSIFMLRLFSPFFPFCSAWPGGCKGRKSTSVPREDKLSRITYNYVNMITMYQNIQKSFFVPVSSLIIKTYFSNIISEYLSIFIFLADRLHGGPCTYH